MSYQVLARKWRPKSFAEVVGQDHVLKVLANALSLGRVHHAYLFSGTRGVGKTSIARLLAKGLNCEAGITATPCGVCDNCQDIEQGRCVDLLEIDAASRTKVEDTREILDNIQYLPTKGRFKVYLIDEVHMLSRSSFNALLKTLEEPPEHVKFLLATTDPQKLPITILSRCLHLHLSVLDNALIMPQLIKILQSEQIPAEEKAITLLAKAANGSMRDALSLTDQAIALGNGKVDFTSVTLMLGTLDKAIPFALVESLYQGDGNTLMQHIESAATQGIDWDNLLIETISLLHQISLLQIVPSATGDYSDYETRIRYLAQYISPNDVQLFYQILLVGRKELIYAPDKRIGVEMSFLRALAFVPKTLDLASTGVEPEKTATNIQRSNTDTSASVSRTLPYTKKVTPENNGNIVSSQQSQSPQQQSTSENRVEDIPLDDVSDLTKNILAVRQQLIDGEKTIKKSEKVGGNQPEKVQNDIVKNSIAKRLVENSIPSAEEPKSGTSSESESEEHTSIEEADTAETYQWQFSEHFTQHTDNSLSARSLRLLLEHEKTPELTLKLIQEAVNIDSWSAEIEQISLPPLIKQIAINTYLEEVNELTLVLHLRSSLAHLIKNQTHVQRLGEILSVGRGKILNVSVVIDDDKLHLTPLEVREKIYQDKLEQAKQRIYQDAKVSMICQFFEAKIDDDSIRPV